MNGSPAPQSNDPGLPAEEVVYRARVMKNFDLLKRLLLEVLEDPTRADEIPDGAHVVLFDANDDEIDPVKVAAAERMERAGLPVVRVMVK